MSNITCPSCGASNPAGRHACVECYARLIGPPSTPGRKKIGSAAQASVALPRVRLLPSPADIAKCSAYDMIAGTVAVVALLYLLRVVDPGYWAAAAQYMSALGIAAVGLAFVVRSGGVDLSVGAVAALGGVVALSLSSLGVTFAVLVGLLAGALVGLLNGWAIVRTRCHSSLITLASAGLVSGILMAYGLGDIAVTKGSAYAGIAQGSLGLAPAPLLIWLLVVLVTQYVMRGLVSRTESAGDEESPDIRPTVYTLSGGLSALTGIVLTSKGMTGGDIILSAWFLLPLAAVLLGGALIEKRTASVTQASVGAILLGAMLWRVDFLHVPMLAFLIAGIALLAASLTSAWKETPPRQTLQLLRDGGGGNALSAVLAVGLLGGGFGVFNDLTNRVPAHSALLVQRLGDCQYMPANGLEWKPAEGRVVLSEGDRVRTAPRAAMVFRMSDDSVLKLDSNSELLFTSIGRQKDDTNTTDLRLSMGRVWTAVEKLAGQQRKFEVETPSAVAAVRGTRFSVASSSERDYVSVADGAVVVAASGQKVLVPAGNEVDVEAGAPPSRPRAMSLTERNSWAKQSAILSDPTRTDLSEAMGEEALLEDDFNDNQIDNGQWRIRDDEAADIAERDGKLEIVGLPEMSTGKPTSYGLVTDLFEPQTCEATVVLHRMRGSGEALFRIADSRGGANSVGIAVDGKGRYRLVDSRRPDHNVAARKTVVATRPHMLGVKYDHGTGAVTVTMDGLTAGSAPLDVRGNLHFELLWTGIQPPKAKGFVCAYDDFGSDVRLPATRAVRTIVASVGDTAKGAQQDTVLMVQSLSKKVRLASARVVFPKKLISKKTRIFAGGSGTAKLTKRRRTQLWTHTATGVAPGEGNYLFNFAIGGGQTTSVHQMRLKKGDLIPAPQVKVTLAKEGKEMWLQWPPVPTADSYWVELRDPKTREALYASKPFTTTGARIPLSAKLASAPSLLPLVIAHRGERATSSMADEWATTCALMNEWLTPGIACQMAVDSPLGADSFSIWCGKAIPRG